VGEKTKGLDKTKKEEGTRRPFKKSDAIPS